VDLRQKKTRAKRRELTKHEKTLKTPKQLAKIAKYGKKRVYALKLTA